MPNIIVQAPVAQIQFQSKQDFVNWINLMLYEPAATFGLKISLEEIKKDEVKVSRG